MDKTVERRSYIEFKLSIMSKKHILFLFPGAGGAPVGGCKVALEYANRLVKDGYEVGVVYPSYCFQFNLSLWGFLRRFCKSVLRFVYFGLTRKYSCQKWFKLDKRVKEYWVWSLDEIFVPQTDSYVATAVQTSVYLNRYKALNIKKYYLIQGFEAWDGVTPEQVIATYHYPLRKIVIASWLEHIVRNAGETCITIFNGFDFDYFKYSIPLEQRNKYKVCMLYHSSKAKGCADGFRALEIVKAKIPELQVNIFGVCSCPKGLPEWYHYCRCPNKETHNRLYNESAIFIGTSWSEGWGLTVGEAMICGCAVACTNNAGYLEMAVDGETALVSPIKDSEALAANIIRLIENDDLRFRIAENGNRNIQQFTWKRAYMHFRRLLD